MVASSSRDALDAAVHEFTRKLDSSLDGKDILESEELKDILASAEKAGLSALRERCERGDSV